MISFIKDLITRSNFWHPFIIILLWTGLGSLLIYWSNALTQFILRSMKEKHETIWWHVIIWNNLYKFFSKPKKWKRKQKIIIGLIISIFLLQHFGYNSYAGKNFYAGCGQVKRFLTLEIALEHLSGKAQKSKKKVWWEIPVKFLLNTARMAGTIKKSTDAISTIENTGKSIENIFD